MRDRPRLESAALSTVIATLALIVLITDIFTSLGVAVGVLCLVPVALHGPSSRYRACFEPAGAGVAIARDGREGDVTTPLDADKRLSQSWVWMPR